MLLVRGRFQIKQREAPRQRCWLEPAALCLWNSGNVFRFSLQHLTWHCKTRIFPLGLSEEFPPSRRASLQIFLTSQLLGWPILLSFANHVMNYYCLLIMWWSHTFCEENHLLVMILSFSLSQKGRRKKKGRFVPIEAVNGGACVPCFLKDHHTSTPTF